MPDGNSQILRSYVFGPSGFWTMAPLHYAATFDPFLSLDCAPTPSSASTLAQSKERKGSNFAIWQPWCVCTRRTWEAAFITSVSRAPLSGSGQSCSERARAPKVAACEREVRLFRYCSQSHCVVDSSLAVFLAPHNHNTLAQVNGAKVNGPSVRLRVHFLEQRQ